jgi:hypothetical protein
MMVRCCPPPGNGKGCSCYHDLVIVVDMTMVLWSLNMVQQKDKRISSQDGSTEMGIADPLAQLLLDKPASLGLPTSSGILVGVLIGLQHGNTPLVAIPGDVVARSARSIVDLHRTHVGRQVMITFENDDRDLPIVMGVIRGGANVPSVPAAGQVEVDADGERMMLSAQRELVLRCGKASITLDHQGRITIRGARIISHAEGSNRIRGGSVELN